MLKKISVKRLKVGLHIYLKDIPWFKHPFFRSNFKIKSNNEIYDIQGIGCEYVYYDATKSSVEPLRQDSPAKAPSNSSVKSTEIKKERSVALRKRKEAFIKTEKKFIASAEKADQIMQGILKGQVSFCDEAEQMANEFADFFLSDAETTLNLINLSSSDEAALYYHSLNVAILACMLGSELGVNAADMRNLSLGALMHDIGKSKIPKKILYKSNAMTKPELEMIKMHTFYGVEILSAVKDVHRDVMKAVYHHHVVNGKGSYPTSVDYETKSLIAKVVTVVNVYDNLINDRSVDKSLTPHKALAYMYKVYSEKLDSNVLGHFIRMLGVYPPGSICELDSGEIAMVVSIGENPLLPEVVLCDLNVPKNEAMIIKLGTDIDSKVEKVLAPTDLTSDQVKYLSPKTKIGYYAEVKDKTKE
ncbi:HD-GYP domain-containing protein [Maridesulfovibrio sp.]|uniref:HD-GYP domain-containing protein n=1 Tax=unclassified Maridesulfovibrio TaxID=2794999 RepID=UPI003B00B9E5